MNHLLYFTVITPLLGATAENKRIRSWFTSQLLRELLWLLQPEIWFRSYKREAFEDAPLLKDHQGKRKISSKV